MTICPHCAEWLFMLSLTVRAPAWYYGRLLGLWLERVTR